MSECNDVQSQLAGDDSHDIDSVEYATLMAHCDSCDDCSTFLHNLSALNDDFEQWAPVDAPDALIEKTLTAVRQHTVAPTAQPRVTSRDRQWSIALGSVAVVIAAIHLTTLMSGQDGRHRISDWQLSSDLHVAAQQPAALSPRAPEKSSHQGLATAAPDVGVAVDRVISSPVAALHDDVSDADESAAAATREVRRDAEKKRQKLEKSDRQQEAVSQSALARNKAIIAKRVKKQRRNEAEASRSPSEFKRLKDASDGLGSTRENSAAPTADTGRRDQNNETNKNTAGVLESKIIGGDLDDKRETEIAPMVSPASPRPLKQRAESKLRSREAAPSVDTTSSDATELSAIPRAEQQAASVEETVATKQLPASRQELISVGRDGAASARLAAQFINRYETLSNLNFKHATGYWKNTYLPGDPLMRQLKAALKRWDRQGQLSNANIDTRLEQGIAPAKQAFDSPTQSAIGLYLHADKSAASSRSRVRLQIGLKGAQRQGGQRPAMNIAVVLDRRSIENDKAALQRAQAVLTALTKAKQPDDYFTLTMTGRGGGLVLNADQFRYGPVSLAIRQLSTKSSGNTVGLADVINRAASSINSPNEQSADAAPLGTNLVLLLATQSVTDEIPALIPLVHRNAVAGINLSAVVLSDTVESQSIRQLVLSGQGNLRRLLTPANATQTVNRELFASSRAVARALRLKIQLAPGVKLVDVIGSYRLDEPQAQRVREAENSIDQKIARNLGIRSDRGEDEDGIQIVIPHFNANDEHIILLDLVVPGSGPVADVSVRYKDLVFLRNGAASSRLQLPSGTHQTGPLQSNVTLNLLDHHVAQSARQSSVLLNTNQRHSALVELWNLQSLLTGLQHTVEGLADHAQLNTEIRIINDYITVLESTDPNNRHLQQNISRSLHYASYRKTQFQDKAR